MSEVLWQRALVDRLRRDGLHRYLTLAERDVARALVRRFEATGELSPRLGQLLSTLVGRAEYREATPRRRLYAVRNGAGEEPR